MVIWAIVATEIRPSCRQTRSASIAVHRGIMESSGLKIEALRRFNEDGFLGIGLKAPIFARTGGESVQSRQTRHINPAHPDV